MASEATITKIYETLEAARKVHEELDKEFCSSAPFLSPHQAAMLAYKRDLAWKRRVEAAAEWDRLIHES